MSRTSAAAVLVPLLIVLPLSADAAIQVGEPAPPFTKFALGGGSISLSDYAGKVVVLDFFGYD